MTTSSTPLILDRDASIARIRFNRPDVLNAADSALALTFRDACRTIAADPTVWVVVVDGAGSSFMAGGDITQFREPPAGIPATARLSGTQTSSASAPPLAPNTSAPGRNRVTSLPTASTTPAKSRPGMRGGTVWRMRPATFFTSDGLMEAA